MYETQYNTLESVLAHVVPSRRKKRQMPVSVEGSGKFISFLTVCVRERERERERVCVIFDIECSQNTLQCMLLATHPFNWETNHLPS